MKFKSNYIIILAVFFCSLNTGCDQEAESNIFVQQTDKTLSVSVTLPDDVKEIEIRLASDRNLRISKRTDISLHNPNKGQSPVESEIWYPIVDVALDEQIEAVALFDEETKGEYSINGIFYEHEMPIAEKTIIPGSKLAHWENTLIIKPASLLEGFYLRARFPVSGKEFHQDFKLLSENWSGVVSVYAVYPNELLKIAETALQGAERSKEVTRLAELKGQGITKERLIESLKATVGFTLRCQDSSPNTSTSGGLNLFYDLDAKTYRRPHWIWGWGTSIKLLLDASKIAEVTKDISAERLKKTAIEIGHASRRFQITDPNHPSHGVVLSRWKDEGGLTEFYSVADALFLVGWGWMPLYTETKDERFLEGSQLLVNATERLLGEFEVIPMDYIETENRWKDYTLNESGFGTEGFAEVYRVTQDERTREIGEIYMDRLLSKFQRPDSLWQRIYNSKTKKTSPTVYRTRGQGWAMEGLLASARMRPDGKYRQLAIQMAEVLMKWQDESGFWWYDFNKREKAQGVIGISEKGTALWSLLFYRLYDITGDPRHLEAARKALIWCMDNQYTGEDSDAYGSLVGISPFSGVTYRRWFPLSCIYTSGFFGLAVLEELKIVKINR